MSNEISEEDIADFRKHVKSGNLSSAKMILYRVSRAQTPSEAAQVVPLDKAKIDFLKYWKHGNLKFCASILAKNKNLIEESDKEIEEIMTKNKENKENELNFTENHFPGEQTHEASNGELDDFELVEAHEEGFVMVGKSGGTLDHLNVSHTGGKSKDIIL